MKKLHIWIRGCSDAWYCLLRRVSCWLQSRSQDALIERQEGDPRHTANSAAPDDDNAAASDDDDDEEEEDGDDYGGGDWGAPGFMVMVVYWGWWW